MSTNTVPESLPPVNFRAEFARIAAEAERHLEAVDDCCYEARLLMDRLLAMHPEVERWSNEQRALEILYGADALDQAERCADYDHDRYVAEHDCSDVYYGWMG